VGTAAASTPSNATGRRTREQILRAGRARELKKGASPASSPVAIWRECGNVHGDGRVMATSVGRMDQYLLR
jgi:hypothetical protein